VHKYTRPPSLSLSLSSSLSLAHIDILALSTCLDAHIPVRCDVFVCACVCVSVCVSVFARFSFVYA